MLRRWLVAAVLLVPAAPASGQSLPETLTVGASAEVSGNVALKAGVDYELTVSGEMKVSVDLGANSYARLWDAFWCFRSEGNDTQCSTPNHDDNGPLRVRTSGDVPGAYSTVAAYANPRHTYPPYSAQHGYTVVFTPFKDGTLGLSTKQHCSQSQQTSCSGQFTVTVAEAEGDGVVVSGLSRKVEVQRNFSGWEPATEGMKLKAGDGIHTGFKAGVRLTFPDGSIVDVRPLSLVVIEEILRDPGGKYRIRVNLQTGEVKAQVNRVTGSRSDFIFKTVTSTASIRGTVLTVTANPRSTTVAVTEGSVEVALNSGAAATVTAGDEIRATATRLTKPVRIGSVRHGGLSERAARALLSRRVARGLTRCRFEGLSSALSPARGGWRATLVLVGRRAEPDAKPKGTAVFAVSAGRVRARNPIARRVLAGCR